MAVQAVWYDMVIGVSKNFVRSIQGLSTSRSLVFEEEETNNWTHGTWSKGYIGAAEFDLNLVYTRSATGQDPRRNYGDWQDRLGYHSAFYLGGRAFMAGEFMLTNLTTNNWVFDTFGEALRVDVTAHFKEFIQDWGNAFHLLDHENDYISDLNWGTLPQNTEYWKKHAERLFNSASAGTQNRIKFNPQFQTKWSVPGYSWVMNDTFGDQMSGWY